MTVRPLTVVNTGYNFAKDVSNMYCTLLDILLPVIPARKLEVKFLCLCLRIYGKSTLNYMYCNW